MKYLSRLTHRDWLLMTKEDVVDLAVVHCQKEF